LHGGDQKRLGKDEIFSMLTNREKIKRDFLIKVGRQRAIREFKKDGCHSDTRGARVRNLLSLTPETAARETVFFSKANITHVASLAKAT
jgi:hypothetical protein